MSVLSNDFKSFITGSKKWEGPRTVAQLFAWVAVLRVLVLKCKQHVQCGLE